MIYLTILIGVVAYASALPLGRPLAVLCALLAAAAVPAIAFH